MKYLTILGLLVPFFFGTSVLAKADIHTKNNITTEQNAVDYTNEGLNLEDKASNEYFYNAYYPNYYGPYYYGYPYYYNYYLPSYYYGYGYPYYGYGYGYGYSSGYGYPTYYKKTIKIKKK